MKTFLKYQYGQVSQVCNLIRSFYVHVYVALPIDTNALGTTPALNNTSTSSSQSLFSQYS